MIRIMLADDHAVVRSGLRRLLEHYPNFEIVAEAESGERAYQLFGEHLPDVAVIDLSMPGMGGLEAIRRILARYPTARTLVLSMHENAAFASQALKSGARGYLAKSSLAEDLVTALTDVARGKVYISAEVAKKIALQSLTGEGDPMQQLSAREFEVFRLLAEGKDSEQIADMLKLSQKTIANYHTAIKQKLGVSNPVELVRLAIRFGLIES
ncbi:MAG: DNA-binding response regulator [Nitrosomonadales bacterium]|nr:MAG: DNA-binding response regulator [Nitrosomonadales bacterium]